MRSGGTPGPPRGSQKRPERPLGGPWGAPGVVLRSPGVVLGSPGVLPGHPGSLLGCSWSALEVSWGCFGRLLGALGEHFEVIFHEMCAPEVSRWKKLVFKSFFVVCSFIFDLAEVLPTRAGSSGSDLGHSRCFSVFGVFSFKVFLILVIILLILGLCP